MHHFWYCLPAHASLPWLFLVLDLISYFGAHAPTSLCFSCVPHHLAYPPTFLPQHNVFGDQNAIYGGGRLQHILFKAICEYIVKGCDIGCGDIFLFVDHADSAGQVAYAFDQGFLHANVPL